MNEWKENCLAKLEKLEHQVKIAIEHMKNDGPFLDMTFPSMPGRFRIGNYQIIDTSEPKTAVCFMCGKTYSGYIEIDFNTFCPGCATQWIQQRIVK